MSNENAFRELKFSPGQLVVVFLAILVLGVFVFLLGISVGKKQTLIKAQAGPATVEKAQAEDLSTRIKVGEFVTTTAPAEAKVDPNAAAAAGLKPDKTESKTVEPAASKAAEKPELKSKPEETKTAENKPAEKKTEPKPAAPEAKTETKPKTAPAAAYQSAPYYVQIGAVEAREAAEAFAKKVNGLGYPTLVLDPFAADKKPVFRVRVGPYPSKAEAADAQAELATALKKKKTDFFLVKT